ncbi:MAG TPA: HEAT repeat domain-containing protein [Bryobacteraceae bacterium]|nr:HEAT repeat domain-containing protein [Bryobacteraceae bacterium]
MNCERMREQIPELLAGRLDSAAREDFIGHLETCSGCRGEVAELGAVWRGLESIPVIEPDRAMRSRFLEVLEAYQAGMDQGRERAIAGKRKWFAAGWWPARAAWQTALSVALLVAGGIGGRYLEKPRAANPEIAQLQNQVENLRQVVAMSMLQDQSPSSRIRGVTYSNQVARPAADMVQALLYAVNHDSNVNVRLSAVDALEKLSGNPEIRRALVDALPLQDSPLVQIALIDVLVQANEKSAVPALRKLATDAQADESVRQRASAGVQKLEVPK